MPRRLALLLTTGLLGGLVAAPALAATRYVATTGSDASNSCTNASAPCASIARCVSQMANGDTCTVANGTYTDPSQATASLNCSASTPCTIKSTNPLGAILNITTAVVGSPTIKVSGNNWVVDGFKVLMGAQHDFVDGTATTGLTFKNNRVEVEPWYGRSALYVKGTSNVLIQNNWVHHVPSCVNDARCSQGGYDSCDFVDVGQDKAMVWFNIDTGTNIVFEGNDFGHGRNPTAFRNITTLKIRKNLCVNATNHGCFFANDVRDVLVENNIGDIETRAECLSRDAMGGEVLQSSLWDTYCAADVTVRNNTVVGHGIGWNQELADQEPNAGASSACTDTTGPNVCSNGGCYQHHLMYNNIVYDGWPAGSSAMDLSGVGYTGTAPRFRADNNIYFNPTGRCIARLGSPKCDMATWQATDVDGDGVTEDRAGKWVAPQFVSYAGHDYRPASATAPQVNAGSNTSILPCATEDYTGAARTDGLCDIGAHELGGGPPPTAPGTVQNLLRLDRR